MRYRVLLGLTFLALSPGLKAVRLESTRLAPEASVWFEPNHGQVGGRTEWTARAAGAWLFLTSNEVVYALPPDVHFDPKKTRSLPTAKTTNVHMRMVGGRRVKGVGEKALGGYSNYFLGKHENEWFSGVPHFGQVRFPEVYPGIDVVFYTTGRNVEYDFIVKPGADPSVIELAFDGTVRVDEAGDLVVFAGGKSFRQHRPRVFQGPTEIEAAYRLTEHGTVMVEIAEFDPLISLRVDPVLDFSTYLGGPGEDFITAITIPPDGNPVLAGGTQSPASPSLDPFQQPSVVSLAPIILKMSADGKRVIFFTILGRNGWDSATAIGSERDGSLTIGGQTNSGNFPLRNAFQTDFYAAYWISFVAKLSPDSRTLIYASYLGGSNTDYMRGVMVDRTGNAWYIGSACSADFPLKNPIQGRFGGGCDGSIVKVSPTGAMLYSTFFGGDHWQGFQSAVQAPDGTVWLAGYSHSADIPLVDPIQTSRTARDGWPSSTLVHIAEDGSKILSSTFLGGTTVGWGNGVQLDSQANIWVSGGASDRGLPLVNAFQSEYLPGTDSSYLMELDPSGRKILYSTYLNGFGVNGAGANIVIDNADNIYIGGSASSSDFVLKDSIQNFVGGGVLNSDQAVMKFSPGAKTLIYSTVIGGRGGENGPKLALGPDGSLFGVGATLSPDYPTKNAYQPASGGSQEGTFFRLSDRSPTPIPSFSVSPGQLTFRFVQGDSSPQAQKLTVSGAAPGLLATATEP